MTVTSTLHINFKGNAKEALEFYHSIFGGDIVLALYGDVEAGQSAAQSEQVAWGEVQAPNGFHIMAYDVQDSLPYASGENAFYVSLRSNETEEIENIGNALVQSQGVTIHVPFGPSVCSPLPASSPTALV